MILCGSFVPSFMDEWMFTLDYCIVIIMLISDRIIRILSKQDISQIVLFFSMEQNTLPAELDQVEIEKRWLNIIEGQPK